MKSISKILLWTMPLSAHAFQSKKIVVNVVVTTTTAARSAPAPVSPTQPTTTAAPPVVTFAPASGSYLAGQTVALADSTPAAVIHYTVDGSVPSPRSPVYTGPLTLATSETIRAVAVKAGASSAVGSAAYVVTTPHLAFSTQPASGWTGVAMTPAPTVNIVDGAGNLLSGASAAVTVSLSGSGGVLGGTTTVQAVGGVARFTNLTVSGAGTYNLVALGTDGAGATSGAFTVSVPTVTLNLASTSVNVGGSLTGTVSLNSTAGAGGATVTLASSFPDLLSFSPSVVTIAAGQSAATFGISGLAAGTTTLTAKVPGFASGNASFTVNPTSSTGKTYYVSNSGLDTSDGLSATTAWKTVARVNRATLKAGDQVLLQSNGVWHEELDVPTAGVRFGSYGPQRSCTINALLVAQCTGMPILDGADSVTGWTVQSGAAYKAVYKSVANKGFVDAVYSQAKPLTLVANVAAVVGTAGSIFSDGNYVYVHLADGSNPTSHTVEISGSRTYGVYVGANSGTTIDGLEIIRASKSGILAYDGANTAQNLTIQNNVLFNIGDTGSDPTPNANNGIVERAEGGIMMQTLYGQTMTGLTVQGNWVGQMDFADMAPSNTQSGIQVYSATAPLISANKVATVHGAGIQVTDGFSTTCTAPVITGNEIANSEAGIAMLGCHDAKITYNTIHDGFGNGIAIGGALRSADLDNANPYLAFNTVHDIAPGYNNVEFNGIDVNRSLNGTAVGNTVYAVAAANMTLEGGSTGWTLMGNTFDASADTLYDGAPTNSSSFGLVMYLMNTAMPVKMIGNTFLYDPVTSRMSYGAAFGGDASHLYTDAQFRLAVPSAEATGAVTSQTSLLTTVSSGTVLTPTAQVMHVTGTSAIATITPPNASYIGCIRLFGDGVWTTTTTGNINTAMTSQTGTQYMACYDGTSWTIR